MSISVIKCTRSHLLLADLNVLELGHVVRDAYRGPKLVRIRVNAVLLELLYYPRAIGEVLRGIQVIIIDTACARPGSRRSCGRCGGSFRSFLLSFLLRGGLGLQLSWVMMQGRYNSFS